MGISDSAEWQALAEHQPAKRAEHLAVLEMLEADRGEFLSFAMLVARKR